MHVCFGGGGRLQRAFCAAQLSVIPFSPLPSACWVTFLKQSQFVPEIIACHHLIYNVYME